MLHELRKPRVKFQINPGDGYFSFRINDASTDLDPFLAVAIRDD